MIIFEDDHPSNIVMLSPLDIEDHQKKNSREDSFVGFGEVDQICAVRPVCCWLCVPIKITSKIYRASLSNQNLHSNHMGRSRQCVQDDPAIEKLTQQIEASLALSVS
jgi:hypothetical protein